MRSASASAEQEATSEDPGRHDGLLGVGLVPCNDTASEDPGRHDGSQGLDPPCNDNNNDDKAGEQAGAQTPPGKPGEQPCAKALPGPSPPEPDGPQTPPGRYVHPPHRDCSFIAVMSERSATIRPSSATDRLSSPTLKLLPTFPASSSSSARRMSLQSPSPVRKGLQSHGEASERTGRRQSSLVCRRVGDRIGLAIASSPRRPTDVQQQRHSAPSQRKPDLMHLPPAALSPRPSTYPSDPASTVARAANLQLMRAKQAFQLRNSPAATASAAAACSAYPWPWPETKTRDSLDYSLSSVPPPIPHAVLSQEPLSRNSTSSSGVGPAATAIASQLLMSQRESEPEGTRTSRTSRPASRLSRRSSFLDMTEEDSPEEEPTLRLQRMSGGGSGSFVAALDPPLQLWPL